MDQWHQKTVEAAQTNKNTDEKLGWLAAGHYFRWWKLKNGFVKTNKNR